VKLKADGALKAFESSHTGILSIKQMDKLKPQILPLITNFIEKFDYTALIEAKYFEHASYSVAPDPKILKPPYMNDQLYKLYQEYLKDRKSVQALVNIENYYFKHISTIPLTQLIQDGAFYDPDNPSTGVDRNNLAECLWRDVFSSSNEFPEYADYVDKQATISALTGNIIAREKIFNVPNTDQMQNDSLIDICVLLLGAARAVGMEDRVKEALSNQKDLFLRNSPQYKQSQ
jgi:hypothetical protein